MEIETKFNIGDCVFIIFSESLISAVVYGMRLDDGVVVYEFRRCDFSVNSPFYKPEPECFASIDELCEYYKAKLAK